ncbi:hypothetical protein IWX49DRAFT_596711 [Phyllosticta citricarpa]|uniref:Uncharacterized protein n=1 Tax=Phyllosticta citricarpa TaxID=55181 RepID=A0ABR1MQT2_9PEZI
MRLLNLLSFGLLGLATAAPLSSPNLDPEEVALVKRQQQRTSQAPDPKNLLPFVISDFKYSGTANFFDVAFRVYNINTRIIIKCTAKSSVRSGGVWFNCDRTTTKFRVFVDINDFNGQNGKITLEIFWKHIPYALTQATDESFTSYGYGIFDVQCVPGTQLVTLPEGNPPGAIQTQTTPPEEIPINKLNTNPPPKTDTANTNEVTDEKTKQGGDSTTTSTKTNPNKAVRERKTKRGTTPDTPTTPNPNENNKLTTEPPTTPNPNENNKLTTEPPTTPNPNENNKLTTEPPTTPNPNENNKLTTEPPTTPNPNENNKLTTEPPTTPNPNENNKLTTEQPTTPNPNENNKLTTEPPTTPNPNENNKLTTEQPTTPNTPTTPNPNENNKLTTEQPTTPNNNNQLPPPPTEAATLPPDSGLNPSAYFVEVTCNALGFVDVVVQDVIEGDMQQVPF